MRFSVSNDIKVESPTKELYNWCTENLVIENPEYIKKVRMNKWIGSTPKNIILYERGIDELRLPFGCFKKLYKDFFDKGRFIPDFEFLRKVDYKSCISLYPYQQKAMEKAKEAKNGVIVMPCGSGKTQTALQLVAEIGGRCLWLTHTQDLLNQSMSRAKACFGLQYSDYGMITGGKVNIGKITFATVQTMCKIDLPKYRNEFDIIVVDECHKCIGSPTRVMQFYKVLTNLSARHKFGLTATPKRADGLETSMFALLGDIVAEVPKEEVKNTTCNVKVEFVETGYMPNLDLVLAGDGTINYASLVDDLIHNENRFNLVSNVVKEKAGKGATLVLTNRVEYAEKLNNSFNGKSICLSTLGNSKSAKEVRKKSLMMLNDKELDCIFTTYQLAKEGLDVPNLRYVVFATPEKDETTIVQSAGRVGRKSFGKEFGTVIDFVDDFGMYRGWAKKRRSYYKKLDYEVSE